MSNTTSKSTNPVTRAYALKFAIDQLTRSIEDYERKGVDTNDEDYSATCDSCRTLENMLRTINRGSKSTSGPSKVYQDNERLLNNKVIPFLKALSTPITATDLAKRLGIPEVRTPQKAATVLRVGINNGLIIKNPLNERFVEYQLATFDFKPFTNKKVHHNPKAKVAE